MKDDVGLVVVAGVDATVVGCDVGIGVVFFGVGLLGFFVVGLFGRVGFVCFVFAGVVAGGFGVVRDWQSTPRHFAALHP